LKLKVGIGIIQTKVFSYLPSRGFVFKLYSVPFVRVRVLFFFFIVAAQGALRKFIAFSTNYSSTKHEKRNPHSKSEVGRISRCLQKTYLVADQQMSLDKYSSYTVKRSETNFYMM